MNTRTKRGHKQAADMLSSASFYDKHDKYCTVVDALCALRQYMFVENLSFDEAERLATKHMRAELILDGRDAEEFDDCSDQELSQAGFFCD